MTDQSNEILRELVRVQSGKVDLFTGFREQEAATFVAMSSVAIPVILTVSDPLLRTLGTLFLDSLAVIVWAVGQKSLVRLIFHQRIMDGLLVELAPDARSVMDRIEATVVKSMNQARDGKVVDDFTLSLIHKVPFRRLWDAYLCALLLVSVAIIALSWWRQTH